MREEIKHLLNLLEQKAREEKEQFEERTEVVGYVSIDIQNKLKKLRKEKIKFKEDVDIKRRQLELEMNRKMDELFEDRKEEIEKNHTALWEEIYEVCFLDPNGKYFYEDEKIFKETDN